MGNNLKGKPLGKGLSQRKDGLYEARLTLPSGCRSGKTFQFLGDARRWLEEEKRRNAHLTSLTDITLDEWFQEWVAIKGGYVKSGTVAQYKSQYKNVLQKYLGEMKVRDIKVMHIQKLINDMSLKYKRSTVVNYKNFIFELFDYAVDNEIITSNPANKRIHVPRETVGRYPGVLKSDRSKVLTANEQKSLVKALQKYKDLNVFLFVLQTGLRAGEVAGVKWSNIDFKKKTLKVDSQAMYTRDNGKYVAREDTPKTENGNRIIPLTDEAIRILNEQKKIKPEIIQFEYIDYVFLAKNGMPLKNNNLNRILATASETAQIPHISMHTLRHTFATRCVEGGMKPKTLQAILGHASVTTTMDLYVHVTEDELVTEIGKVSERLCV